jgi:hypothetical protein
MKIRIGLLFLDFELDDESCFPKEISDSFGHSYGTLIA